jgi:serine kinase of HPr protein (carbohydrate metabolism regulator)
MTQKEALAILKLGVNVFLTGEPGAGKTQPSLPMLDKGILKYIIVYLCKWKVN